MPKRVYDNRSNGMVGEHRGGGLQGAGRENKRGLILSEAINLFNNQGYFDTRLEDVADRLGTGKTSISYHFKSKEALLFEAYSATCDFAEAEIGLAAQASTGLGRVLRWVRAFASAQSNAILGQRMPIAMISDANALGADDRDVIARRLAAHAGAIAAFLRAGRSDGSVKVASLEAATFFILSIQHWLRRWLEHITPASHDDAIDLLCHLLTDGIAAEPLSKLPKPLHSAPAATQDFIFDREARNQMKLDAFLRSGTRLLNLRGFRSMSLSAVAGELGVTRGAFYYQFDDKNALLKSCAERSLDLIEESLAAHQQSCRPALERLHLVLATLFEGHLTDLNPLLRQSLYASLPERVRPIILARSRRLTAAFGELVAEGVADGSMRPLDLEAMEYLVCGTLYSATQRRLRAFSISPAGDASSGLPISATAYFSCLYRGLRNAPAE